MNDKDKGIYHKFNIARTDGSSAPGGKHYECEYFVLDLDHDPHARPALKAYADSCKDDYPRLADDLFEKLNSLFGFGGSKPDWLPAQPSPDAAQGDWIDANDVKRLVRELDVALNGEGAAPQASLCDIVAQSVQAAWADCTVCGGSKQTPPCSTCNGRGKRLVAAHTVCTCKNGVAKNMARPCTSFDRSPTAGVKHCRLCGHYIDCPSQAHKAIAADRQNRASQPVQDAPVVPDLQAWDDTELGLYVKNALDSSTSIDQCGRVMRRFISSMYPQPVQGVAESVADEERFDNLLIRLSVALYEGGKRGDNEAGVAETEAVRSFFKQSRQSPRAGMVSVPRAAVIFALGCLDGRMQALKGNDQYASDYKLATNSSEALHNALSHSSKGDEHVR